MKNESKKLLSKLVPFLNENTNIFNGTTSYHVTIPALDDNVRWQKYFSYVKYCSHLTRKMKKEGTSIFKKINIDKYVPHEFELVKSLFIAEYSIVNNENRNLLYISHESINSVDEFKTKVLELALAIINTALDEDEKALIASFMSEKNREEISNYIEKLGVSKPIGNSKYTRLMSFFNYYKNDGVESLLVDNEVENKLVIFYGPPGTGKTKVAKEFIITELESDDEHCCIVQIHPSYSYEDLIEGIKPVVYSNGDIKYQVVDGPVKVMVRKATGKSVKLLCMVTGNSVCLPQGSKAKYGFNEIYCSTNEDLNLGENNQTGVITSDNFVMDEVLADDQIEEINSVCINPEKTYFIELYFKDASWGKGNYALILDEINRGHMATILGELLFALSEARAELIERKSVKLQYSSEDFIWPNNLSLLGTLNTADTTTDKVDQAIKRRFEFVNVPPIVDVDKWKKMKLEVKSEEKFIGQFFEKNLSEDLWPWKILEALNLLLVNDIAEDLGALNIKEKLIGHSYFIKYARLVMDKKSEDIDNLKLISINILNKIYHKEIRHSLLSIFNNSEDSLLTFEDEFQENEYLSLIKTAATDELFYFEEDEDCLKEQISDIRKGKLKVEASKIQAGPSLKKRNG